MNSNENASKLFNSTEQKKINRRTFFTQSVGCAAGLTFLASPGIITRVLAAQEDKSKEDSAIDRFFEELGLVAGRPNSPPNEFEGGVLTWRGVPDNGQGQGDQTPAEATERSECADTENQGGSGSGEARIITARSFGWVTTRR